MKKYSMEKNKKDIKLFLVRTMSFIILLYLIFGIVFGVTMMQNGDMDPQIHAGDLLLYYRLDKEYLANDVVVSKVMNKQFVGRVIARPGDVIEITEDGHVLINDSLVVENDIYYSTPQYDSDIEYPVQLEDDEYFILCDQRNGAVDSRVYGVIRTEEIKGKIITILRKNRI